MIIEVKNCHDCPFCNNETYEGTSCNYPDNDVDESEMTEYGKEDLPIKCPLKKGTTIIKIKL